MPALPLLGALCNLAFGRWLERRGRQSVIHAIAIVSVTAAFVLTVVSTVRLAGLTPENRAFEQILWNLFREGAVRVDIGFTLDPLSSVMCLVITGIGALIHIYSAAYMKGEAGYGRYFFALNLFVFAMLVLVLADNLVLMFVGWEGVGVCSYILIGFWFEDRLKARAAFKAFIVNRIGDAAFIVGMLLLFWALGGSWHLTSSKSDAHEARWASVDPDYAPGDDTSRLYQPHREVDERRQPTFRFDLMKAQLAQLDIGAREDLQARSFHGVPLLVLIGLLLFVGAAAKSAQIPLYVWLPDAMAGPTPVSALIHAATMVTAGVYLVARMSFLFALDPIVMTTIASVGAATALFAACIAVAQTDLKRVLAYSTVSQLGLMFLGAGSGAFGASVFHLVTHAFFKACLFLAAGSVIYACHHEQDMRRMGGLGRAMPITRACYLYACIAISGLPLASGFFSKDELLFAAVIAGKNVVPGAGTPLFLVGLATSVLTSFYMWRSYYLTFSGSYRGDAAHPPKESPATMTWVLLILAAGSGITAVLGFWPVLGHSLEVAWLEHPILETWLGSSLTPVPGWVRQNNASVFHSESWAVVIAAVVAAFAGLGAAWALFGRGRALAPRNARRFRRTREAALEGFYVDAVYDVLIVAPTRLLATGLATFDRVVVDGAVQLVARGSRALANAENVFDRVLVDGMVNGLASAIGAAGRRIRETQTGRLQNYVYVAVAGALVVIGLKLLLVR